MFLGNLIYPQLSGRNISSFQQLSRRHSARAYHVPGAVPHPGDATVNETGLAGLSWGCVLVGPGRDRWSTDNKLKANK